MAITLKEIAKLAEVSTSTVSRVMNDDPRISSATKDKVIKCLETLDYKAPALSKWYQTKDTYTIGFVTPDISENFFMNIAAKVDETLFKSGYSLLICGTNNNVKCEKNRIEVLRDKQVDGVIIVPTTNSSSNYEILRQAGIPVVIVDRYIENFAADMVMVDNINAAYSAIEYLIDKGASRIGFIGGEKTLSNAQERFKGYERALRDYNIQPDQKIIKYGDFTEESGYLLAKELLNIEKPPQFLFVSNYYMHIGVMRYLSERKVNGIASIIHTAGFDDIRFPPHLKGVSVIVSQPISEIGETAAKLILKRIGSKVQKSRYVTKRLKTKLIEYGV
ncbi:MAG: LacI family DNA-binding transcriptional regulator [Deltaproteobacteria bacterium]|jgi:LacI family transcriptional regulator|nr:LacI family DNA-binding transcriptional regulator [Deltaproteobacteria bacterium]MBT4525976.1 LacI family DNA-binding transcriptional regulator [Deltaproteobacteria bacterium]